MLYPEKLLPFSEALMKDPPAIYRGTPFWAWNSALHEEVLTEQIGIFRQMGFGGFHIHVRQGLETPYLSEAFTDAVRHSVNEAKKRGMYAWLYDEDRWPSGCAGGEVTKTVAYRQKWLTMTEKRLPDAKNTVSEVAESGAPLFLAAFEIVIDREGALVSYRRLGEDEESSGRSVCFYCITREGGEARFNGQTYVDVLSKEATDRFLETTHEVYKKALGTDFGTTCPAIFTDEPQMAWHSTVKCGSDRSDVSIPWTWDLPETYRETFGEEIVDRLPELFFTDRDGRGGDLRYRYEKHLCDRFCEAYTDRIGAWCRKNGIMLTGHVMGEDTLYENTISVGDPMVCYRGMDLPGMDLLCDDRAFVTAVQCRSAVRQYGREGMLSELYGVTGWDFDFRGHKYQGDWQACLGVTVRVPHLAWQTMKGEGKRDYPAPISYQSPWWEEYALIEDHFARVHLALTRGKPAVRVAVLRPIETYWMYYAQDDLTKTARDGIEERYQTLANWLLRGSVDFDYLSEGLLPELCPQGENPLRVGEMAYDLLIVSDCETLRPHTEKILREYAKAGGKILFLGNLPKYSDGVPSASVAKLPSLGKVLPFSKDKLLREVDSFRDLAIYGEDGCLTEGLFSTLRREEGTSWLFTVHADKPAIPSLAKEQKITIRLRGGFVPALIDTQNGSLSTPEYETDGQETVIRIGIFDYNSLLIKLDDSKNSSSYLPKTEERKTEKITLSPASYSLSDPNVLLLDMAEWSLDGGEYHEADEMMRVDEALRRTLGLPSRRLKVIQPWAIAKAPENHRLTLRFTFFSDARHEGVELAAENLLRSEVTLNGEKVSLCDSGYYVDREIRKTPLPPIEKGKNILTVGFPFGERTDVENAFLLGDFGVSGFGTEIRMTESPSHLAFGDPTRQGLFFYGGNIDYECEFTQSEEAPLLLSANEFRGAAIRVFLDGKDCGAICYPPYRLNLPTAEKGVHRLTLRLFGNRYNTFSALHNLEDEKKRVYIGPVYWRSEGDAFSYEYRTRPLGILKTPELRIVK